ncbi:Recombination protein recR [Mesomycoplasma dispar]|uniref:Recombination protein RecR n=1 Tax=Mesomycoplasma dispar TaxID=86660 RepID=A0AAJ5NSQ1_9BACT|nr:toprim domain-containing protein [Mesomycoplasma dispar]AJR12421.1 recombinase RecR [Mesomycoplasma dispar]ATP59940.1 recombination protein RecR [Mesomycoplasma dispar]VEU62530.1 Recombination protein recR [Mesomycoplasma dispar]
MIKERLENLAEILRQIPGISKKQAMKILFFLIDIPPSQIENFVNSIYELKKNTQYCQKCGYLNSNPVCEICLDFQRSFKILVVENSEMVTKFEKSGKYDGQYFVFGNYDVKKLENHSSQIKKIADLAANKSEIILAFSSTIDGWVFTNYLAKHELLSGLKITRLATGIPFGASIDYIDSITLDQALENRQEMEK